MGLHMCCKLVNADIKYTNQSYDNTKTNVLDPPGKNFTPSQVKTVIVAWW